MARTVTLPDGTAVTDYRAANGFNHQSFYTDARTGFFVDRDGDAHVLRPDSPDSRYVAVNSLLVVGDTDEPAPTATPDHVTTAVQLLGGPSPDLDVAKVAALVALLGGWVPELPTTLPTPDPPTAAAPLGDAVRAEHVGIRVRQARASSVGDYYRHNATADDIGRVGTVLSHDASDNTLLVRWDNEYASGHWTPVSTLDHA